MHQLPPTPEMERKRLARVVALAQYDLDRVQRGELERSSHLRARLHAAQAALEAADDREPGAALAALATAGPGWNEWSYTRRRDALQTKIDAQTPSDASPTGDAAVFAGKESRWSATR